MQRKKLRADAVSNRIVVVVVVVVVLFLFFFYRSSFAPHYLNTWNGLLVTNIQRNECRKSKRRIELGTDKVTFDLAEYLSSRSWRGLEQKLGETPVTKAVDGRKGIAAGYTHEKELKQDNVESTSSQ